MGSARLGRGTEENKMFQDYWHLLQKYWIPEPGNEYWEGLLEDAAVFTEKYKSEYVLDLAYIFFKEQERKFKAGKKIET